MTLLLPGTAATPQNHQGPALWELCVAEPWLSHLAIKHATGRAGLWIPWVPEEPHLSTDTGSERCRVHRTGIFWSSWPRWRFAVGSPLPGADPHPGWGGAVPGALSLLTICPCGPRRGLRGDNPGWKMLGQDGEVYLNCSIEASDTENAAKTKMNKVPCALQMSARDKSRVVYHLGKYGHHQYV